MSFLWIPFRIILNVNVGVGDTRGGAGMIRRSAPRAFDQLHGAEFLNRNTAPVGWRTDWLQATVALSAELIAQNSKLPLLVPPQPVGTKQPRETIVYCGYRTSEFYRSPDEAIDILHCLSCAKRCAHASQDIRQSRQLAL